MLKEEGVERIPGAHCYEFFAGSAEFAAMAEAEPGTFYLTDFLLRHFERLVIEGLGIDRHPELLPSYFGNYQASWSIWPRSPRRRARWTGAGRSRAAWGSHSNIVKPATATLETQRSLDVRARDRARHGPTSRDMASLIIISWRDIPAQVIVKRGRETAKVQLSQRFQEAVDRAAMRAGKGSSDAYLADWQRSAPRPCGEDLKAEADAEAAKLEAQYTDEDLER